MKTLAVALVVLVAVAVQPSTLFAQASESQARATELAKRLGGNEPLSFAAIDPNDPSRFVAALHIPRVQLLVISATYASPALLREAILKGDYQRVYLDLNSAGDREGRFFVEDLGADGLRAERQEGAAFDITWRNAVERTLYNGAWKDQQLTEQQYRERFEKDAVDYAAILQILLAAHAAQSTTPQ